jgi:MoaA/NifB/PqqE/SkfB family radical SAM enzyme
MKKQFDKHKYNEERIVLAEQVPLAKPISIQIAVTEHCNFKCFYCMQSHLQKNKHKFRSLPFAEFKKYVDNIYTTGRVKRVVFCGIGETLLNPQLADMIAYLKEIDFADIYEVVTNATLLTAELSDKLLDAGLNKIKISLQGINAEHYLKNCGVKIDFDQFLSQLEYFYNQSRGRCEIYLKIIDVMLENDVEREEFFGMFSPLGDSVNIEGLVPINAIKAEYDSVLQTTERGFEKAAKDTICPMPFYSVSVNEIGEVYSCCVIDDFENIWKAPKIGNLNEKSFSEIWHSSEHLSQLKGFLNHKPGGSCKDCVAYTFRVAPRDVLNGHEAQILERIIKLEGSK